MTTTLITIGIIYLTIGAFIALLLHFSEYKVPIWNAVGIGVLYPFLILAAVFGLAHSFFIKFIQGFNNSI